MAIADIFILICHNNRSLLVIATYRFYKFYIFNLILLSNYILIIVIQTNYFTPNVHITKQIFTKNNYTLIDKCL